MKWLFLVIVGSLFLLVVSGGMVLLWKRWYREDAQNIIQRVLKNSAVTFVVRLLIRGIEFAFSLVLYGLLTPKEIGPYTLGALLVAQYLGTFTEFGLGVLLTREVAKDLRNAPTLFGLTLALRWIGVIVAIPIIAGIIALYALLEHVGVGEAITPIGQHVIWILFLTLIPSAYSGGVTALYQATERMEIPALIELVTAMFSVLLRVLMLLLGFGILGLAWSAVLTSTGTAMVYVVLQKRDFFPPKVYWEWHSIWSLVPLAFPLMLNNLLNMVFFRFDMFLVKAFGGGRGDLLVQQYAIAYQFINVALVLPPVVTFAVFPLLSRLTVDREKFRQLQQHTLHVLLILAFPMAMGLSVLAPHLITLMTRQNASDYLPISAHVLAILGWFLPCSFVNGFLQYVLIALNQQWVITRAFLIGALVNLGANMLCIPWFGLYAASVITILSEVVLFLVFLPLLRREQLTPPLFSLAWRPVLAALVMGGAMLGVEPWGWGIAVLVAGPVYGGMLWMLGAVGPHERELLRRAFRRSAPG